MKNLIIAFMLILCYSANAQENDDVYAKSSKSIKSKKDDNSLRIKKTNAILDSISYKKNAIHLEGLGSGFFGSINYERYIGKNKYGFMNLRIGGNGFYFPILINQVFVQNKNHHLEIGGGVMLPFSKKRVSNKIYFDSYYFCAAGSFVYRYQNPKGHFIARIGWTPLISLNRDHYSWNYGIGLLTAMEFLWIGGSLGFAF